MPLPPDDGSRTDPKWFVIALAVTSLALIAHYDLRLGMAAGALFGVFAVLWFAIALRFGLIGDGPPTGRRLMQERVRQQLNNRHRAASRTRDGDRRPDA
ncbi:MAG: hypothetical protein GC147_04090 [Porphyrobacter sp.]|nr:hypothetical protein [Porphyrobacter sp.]